MEKRKGESLLIYRNFIFLYAAGDAGKIENLSDFSVLSIDTFPHFTIK
jgi:ribonucleotide reductase beta subunit family protein with ferritin-like domain